MNRTGHIWVTVIFICGVYLIMSNLNATMFFKFSIPMILTSTLPDIIEPAINFSHRRFFHSRRLFGILSVALGIFLILSIKNPNYYYAFFGIMGYILHMLSDLISWRGLPY